MFEKKWSKRKLAENAGLNHNTVHNFWKKPVKYHPRADFVLEIANALGVSMDFLMTGKDPVIKKEKLSPTKEEMIEYIKSLDEETASELKGMIKTFNMMSLKEASRKEQNRRHA